MNPKDFSLALQDPSNLNRDEIDAVLEAQLTTVRGLKQLMSMTAPSTKKTVGKSFHGRGLRNVTNRI